METFRSVLFVVVLVNLAAVVLTLFSGLFAMTRSERGERQSLTSNKLMRLRVALQLSAVLLLGLYFMLSRSGG